MDSHVLPGDFRINLHALAAQRTMKIVLFTEDSSTRRAGGQPCFKIKNYCVTPQSGVTRSLSQHHRSAVLRSIQALRGNFRINQHARRPQQIAQTSKHENSIRGHGLARRQWWDIDIVFFVTSNTAKDGKRSTRNPKRSVFR